MDRIAVSRSMVWVLSLVLGLASWSEAQDRRGGFGGSRFGRGFSRSFDKPTLLRSDQVRDELKLDDSNREKVEKVLASYSEKAREFWGGRGASDEERQEMQKKREALVKATEKELAGILNAEQMKRLNEIHLQQRGISALTDKSFAKTLKLSAEQIGKVEAVMAWQGDEMGKLFESLRSGGDRGGRRGGGRDRGDRGGRRGGGRDSGQRGGFGEMREKMESIRKETETKVLAVLNAEQTKHFADLKGKPFELDRRALFGGGRGFRGGDGGRGGRREGGRSKRKRPELEPDS